MACKAAVKANDYLTQLEMEKLISDLRYIDNPFNCPHGRPIIIKFTEYELDKKFRRIVQEGLKMNNKILVLAGPTAVGKTALSIELAKRLNGEIVSTDSMQIYKYMVIGSA